MAKLAAIIPSDTFSERTKRAIDKIHSNRFLTLKRAMNYSLSKNYQKAMEEYQNFFLIVAAYHNCNVGQISPSFFKKEKNITEIFLLSQAYWDLSKIYDKDPKFSGQVAKNLQKFLEFSQGTKFEYANSKMVRKYLLSANCRNKNEFEKVHKILNKNADKCFVATYCFGEDHKVTKDLRLFKHHILRFSWGKRLVEIYYKFSPKLLKFCIKYPFLGVPLKLFILYPILFLTYIIWDKKIIR